MRHRSAPTATKVDQVEINASTAISDAAAAKTVANQAQEAANAAQTKYTELKNRADATDEEVAAAKAAADQAQADATAAGDAAAAAQSAANSLADRVTSAETSITQNANAISSLATKVSKMRIGGRNYVLDSMDPQVSLPKRWSAVTNCLRTGRSVKPATLSFRGYQNGRNLCSVP